MDGLAQEGRPAQAMCHTKWRGVLLRAQALVWTLGPLTRALCHLWSSIYTSPNLHTAAGPESTSVTQKLPPGIHPGEETGIPHQGRFPGGDASPPGMLHCNCQYGALLPPGMGMAPRAQWPPLGPTLSMQPRTLFSGRT